MRGLLELGEKSELVRKLVQLWRGQQEEEGRQQQGWCMGEGDSVSQLWRCVVGAVWVLDV